MRFQDVSEDALVWVATFMKVRDCFLLMIVLKRRGLPLWKDPELNVDGTRTVHRRSPLHHTLVTNYAHHLRRASRPPFRFGPTDLMASTWGFNAPGEQPQVVLTGSTGLQVVTDQLFSQSDYDIFVTFHAAEQVRTSLLRHTRLVCIDAEHNIGADYATMGTRFHHVENYAMEPLGYRVCCSPGCDHLDVCPSPYNIACAVGRRHKHHLSKGSTTLRSGQPNCCGEQAFPMDKHVEGGYVQLIVGLPEYGNVLHLTAGFDIMQCRISYDGEHFRLVSPYVSSTTNMLFDRWLSLPSIVFRNVAALLSEYYARRISSKGPFGPYQFKAACATMSRLHKYRERGFHLGKAPRFYNHVDWPNVHQPGHEECVVLRAPWSRTEYQDDGRSMNVGPVVPHPWRQGPVHHTRWIKGTKTAGTQTD